MEIRPYDPESGRDRAGLWELKRAFELTLPGDAEKRRAYEGKVTDEYRRRYLDWVDRCVADEPRSVLLADRRPAPRKAADGNPNDGGDGSPDAEAPGIAGYAFVLPERLAMVWDAAVLNEIYVRPARRGSGVADDLIGAAIGVARDQSLPLDRMVLDVDRDNERARAFYRRHGFEHWGEMVAREL